MYLAASFKSPVRCAVVAEDDSAEDPPPAKRVCGGGEGPQGFVFHAESGWYINSSDPAWQYNAQEGLFFHTATQQFFTLNASTGEYQPVSTISPAEPTPFAEATVVAAPMEHLFDIVADYTFMQGRRPQQEDRHTLEPSYGPVCNRRAMFFGVFDGHGGSEVLELPM